MHESVAGYQAVSMMIMSLDMSEPEKYPANPAQVYEDAGELYNKAQELSKKWTSLIPKSDILATSQFHAYRRITTVIAFTVHLYYDLVPWIIGADLRLSNMATEFVAEVRKNLIFQFSVLRDVPAIKQRDIPTISELVSRIDSQVEQQLRPIKSEMGGWNPPIRRFES